MALSAGTKDASDVFTAAHKCDELRTVLKGSTMADYYWISARYAGKCSECECDISEGDRVLYYPNEGKRADIYCRPCGEDVDQPEDDPEVEP